ncbi:MAG: FG-GAP repeat domain-containing protein [Polyangiales bacterium]
MRVVGVFTIGFALIAGGAAFVACGGGDSSTPGGGGGDDSTTGDGGDEGGATFEVGGGCATSDECDGGVCVDGKCCRSADAVCGGTCCATGTVCLFEMCVTPGAPCFTANDCKPGETCETALGDKPTSDAGMGDGACVEPPPIPGRCVPRPPLCPDGDAGVDAGGCIAKCEYKPPVAKLDAVQEWTWGPKAKEFPGFVDVWATPTVGRVFDANCDGKVDQLDPPDVIFVSGNAQNTCCQCNGSTPTSCHTGVLRMLNGRTGEEIWSLRKASASSNGFSGLSVAICDLTGDKKMDIAAVTGEGFVVIVDSTGKVVRTSDKAIPGNASDSFGWGGGLAIADMDHDGSPEIAYGHTVFTTAGGGLTMLFGSAPANSDTELSTFVDLDGDGNLELLVGNKALKIDGTALWDRSAGITGGFPGVGDFDKDGKPEVVLVNAGKLYILNGATGATVLGPTDIPGTGSGGPPTVADFDGDGKPEIGLAMQDKYSAFKPNFGTSKIDMLWSAPNHDLSSSVTGSSVFDFEGDGRAEVIYNDECFLWVYDGPTGAVRFAGLTTSFTGTEASLVADVDGDGHSEILMVSNRADPSAAGWKCNIAPWNMPDTASGRPAWKPPMGGTAYGGITVFGDVANSWVGTRTLWNQHTYHVTNVCDDRDSACVAPNVYGSIPKNEQKNWTLPWLNNFRQNVQDKGIFDAPDAIVSLSARCSTPVVLQASLRNAGLSSLPAGVEVGLYDKTKGDVLLGSVKSTKLLFPGQTEVLDFTVDAAMGGRDDTYYAKVIVDPAKPLFHECRDDNDRSADVRPACPK